MSLDEFDTGSDKCNPDGSARFLNHVLADLCMQASNTEDLKKIKAIIDEKITSSEKQAPQPNPDAERLDRILNDLMSLGLELSLMDRIFPCIKVKDANSSKITLKRCLAAFWDLPSLNCFLGNNRNFTLPRNVELENVELEIKILMTILEIRITLSPFVHLNSKIYSVCIEKQLISQTADMIEIKNIIIAASYKNDILNWLEEQTEVLYKEYDKCKNIVNWTYGALYAENKCVDPFLLWLKVERTKSALVSLRDSFQKIDESVELLEKTKNSFRSPLVAEARENLEAIQKAKKDIFENIINAL